MSNTFKRREIKYVLTKKQQTSFMKAIKENIESDKFGEYTICNIYYDTPDDRLIRRSLEKPVYKEKMRLRSYGRANDQTKIFLELKKKYDGIVYKRRIAMPMEEAREYMAGKSNRNGQIEDEINYFIKMYEGISPSMYISYNRLAYFVTEDPELRITFDHNILWRDKDVSLTSEIYGNSILESNQCVMEIKCAEAMPLWLVKALTDNKIYKTSFSKYGKAYLKKIA